MIVEKKSLGITVFIADNAKGFFLFFITCRLFADYLSIFRLLTGFMSVECLHAVGGLSFFTFENMAVCVEGNSTIPVAKSPAQRHHINTCCYKQRGVCMPQLMIRYLWETVAL